jgi:type I restriction enzyme S subunit
VAEELSDFTQTGTVRINGDLNGEDILKDGDLLFVRSNGNKALVGRCVYVRPNGEKVTFSGFTIRARLKSGAVDPWFMSKVVRSPLFKEALYRLGGGSSINNLSQGVLSEFEFPLPPLPEQRKIAEILRTWDKAIEACERLIELLKARQLALVHQLVFGSRRLGNFARSNKMHKFRWLSVPADWSVAPIGSIADESSEINRDGDAFDVLSCSKHDGFVRSLEYFKKQVFSSDLSGYKIIRRGEFGFPSNHVEEGSIGLQNLVDEGLVSPIYTVFRFHADRVDNDYAYAVLKTDLYRHIFQVSTSASVDRRGSLRWSDFSMLPFPLPPIDEQRAIHKVLAAGLAEIDQQQTERDVLAKQKRGLMQKLLTGEWRVKIDKEPAHG